jgi:hypothetical protein
MESFINGQGWKENISATIRAALVRGDVGFTYGSYIWYESRGCFHSRIFKIY